MTRPAVPIHPRRTITPARRAKVFSTAQGVCHICGERIAAGEPWEVEHVIPLAMGGEDDDGNLKPAHRVCHSSKSLIDRKAIAKAKRIERRDRQGPRLTGRGFDSWRAMDGTPRFKERG